MWWNDRRLVPWNWDCMTCTHFCFCSLLSFLERKGVHWKAEHDPCSGKQSIQTTSHWINYFNSFWNLISAVFKVQIQLRNPKNAEQSRRFSLQLSFLTMGFCIVELTVFQSLKMFVLVCFFFIFRHSDNWVEAWETLNANRIQSKSTWSLSMWH